MCSCYLQESSSDNTDAGDSSNAASMLVSGMVLEGCEWSASRKCIRVGDVAQRRLEPMCLKACLKTAISSASKVRRQLACDIVQRRWLKSAQSYVRVAQGVAMVAVHVDSEDGKVLLQARNARILLT